MLRSHEHRALWCASATDTPNCRCVKTNTAYIGLIKGALLTTQLRMGGELPSVCRLMMVRPAKLSTKYLNCGNISAH